MAGATRSATRACFFCPLAHIDKTTAAATEDPVISSVSAGERSRFFLSRDVIPAVPRQYLGATSYSSCYNRSVTGPLAEVARRSDAAMARARAELVRAVRQASADGMTQTQIAAATGRSQPEVSRLLHFHGTSPRARRLRAHAGDIRRLVAQAGGSNVRVFGSVATGEDHDGSDIDLVFTMQTPISLMRLGALEQQLSDLVGLPVDLVPDAALRPEFRDRVLAEAVAL